MFCLVSKGHQTDVAGKQVLRLVLLPRGPRLPNCPFAGPGPCRVWWPAAHRGPHLPVSPQSSHCRLPLLKYLSRDYPSGLEHPQTPATVSRAHTLPNRSGDSSGGAVSAMGSSCFSVIPKFCSILCFSLASPFPPPPHSSQCFYYTFLSEGVVSPHQTLTDTSQ